MTIAVDWHNPEKTILCYSCHDTWTWDALRIALDSAFHLIDSVNHSIMVLVDMRHSSGTPAISASGLRMVAYSPAVNHPNVQQIVVVGGSPLVRAMYDIFSRLYPQAAAQYRFADSIEQVLALCPPAAASGHNP